MFQCDVLHQIVSQVVRVTAIIARQSSANGTHDFIVALVVIRVRLCYVIAQTHLTEAKLGTIGTRERDLVEHVDRIRAIEQIAIALCEYALHGMCAQVV